LSSLFFRAYAVLRAAPVSVASPAPSNLQQTVIAEEDPVLPNLVHAAEDNPATDMPSENPPVSSPVHHPVEEEVQVLGSQFVKPPDSSSVLAKVISDVKPVEKNKVSASDSGSLDNLDILALLQEFTQTRHREDNIIDILKKKYEVKLFICSYPVAVKYRFISLLKSGT
jgi:hypothetical protein